MVTATHIALEIAGVKRPSSEFHALHKCDNPSCCNPEHLYWGTEAQNVRDREERGRGGKRGAKPGIDNHASKLNEQSVREIRASSLGPVALSRIYGVGHVTISKVLKRITWQHVT